MSGWRASKERDLPLVREDYTKRGLSISGIAQKWKRAGKPISRNTISAWRHDDEAAGNPNWDDLRAENDPPSLLEQRDIVAWRLAELLRTRGRVMQDKAAVADMTQLRETLDWFEKRINDPRRHLVAYRLLLDFMLDEGASQDDISVVRTWFTQAMDGLKSGKFKCQVVTE